MHFLHNHEHYKSASSYRFLISHHIPHLSSQASSIYNLYSEYNSRLLYQAAWNFRFSKLKKLWGGKHSKLRSPLFPLTLPLSGHADCCRLWRCVQVLVGRWMLRYWLCNVEPIPLSPATSKLSLSYQLSSIALIAHPLPSNHRETQPFLPAIQRSTDSSSNYRAATLPYRHEKPAREACAACRRTLQEGSWFLAGGNLRCFTKVRCLSGCKTRVRTFVKRF